MSDRASLQPQKRRQFNKTGAKQGIVFLAGGATAVGSAITGIGAQIAFAPMLNWMLGFSMEKAQATAIRYALYASVAALVGMYYAGIRPAGFFLGGLVLFVTATFGALLTARLAPKPEEVGKKRLFLSVGMLLMVGVLAQTMRSNLFLPPYLAYWNSLPAFAGFGLMTGMLTQALGLPGGMLLVAALHFFGGLKPEVAVFYSLLVVALASILPNWAYGKRGLSDAAYGNPAVSGGVIGGFFGGMLLHALSDKVAMSLFGVIALFLCAREISLLSVAPSASPVSPPSDENRR